MLHQLLSDALAALVAADPEHTQTWLAKEIGVEPATVSRWLSGARSPEAVHLVKLGEKLRLDLGVLLAAKAATPIRTDAVADAAVPTEAA